MIADDQYIERSGLAPGEFRSIGLLAVGLGLIIGLPGRGFEIGLMAAIVSAVALLATFRLVGGLVDRRSRRVDAHRRPRRRPEGW